MPQSSSVARPVAENARPETTRRFTVTSLLNVFGPFLILAFVVILFASIMPSDVRGTFFSIYNFKLILTQTVIVAMGALGMTMIIVSGGIDLSVGSAVALTSVLAAWLASHGHSRDVAGVAAVALGGGSVAS